MVQCKSLAKRIRSFFVINLDFYFFNDNVYHFGKKNLMPVFKIICDEDDSRKNQFQVIETNEKGKKKAPPAQVQNDVSVVINNEVLMTLI